MNLLFTIHASISLFESPFLLEGVRSRPVAQFERKIALTSFLSFPNCFYHVTFSGNFGIAADVVANKD